MRSRIQFLFLAFLAGLAAVILRLSYWQVIQAADLASQARDQYVAKDVVDGSRGAIVTADNFPLVVNQPVYTLGAYLPAVTDKPAAIVERIMPILELKIEDPSIATDAAKLARALEELKSTTKATI